MGPARLCGSVPDSPAAFFCLQADWVQQRDAIESAAAAREANWAAANAKLEAESRSKDLTLAAAIEGIVKSKDAEMAALVAKHKEELAVARGQPRPPRPAPPVAETLPQPPFPSQPSAPAYPPYFPSASGAYGLDPCSTTSLAVSSSDNLHPALLQVGGAGESQASVAADAADSSFGTAEVSGRPIPKGAVVAGSSKPRVFKPQLDLPKNSEPLPPPLPSNWERKELSGGKVLLLIEALPGPDAIEGEEEEGYRFWVRAFASPITRAVLPCLPCEKFDAILSSPCARRACMVATHVSVPLQVETCSFNQLNFTIDFDGTSNYKIAFDGPNTTASSATAGSVRVGPYLREPLARLKMADRYTDSLLTYRMSWRLGEPDAAAVAAEQAKEARRLSELIEAAAARQQGPMDVREVPQASDKVRYHPIHPKAHLVSFDWPCTLKSVVLSCPGSSRDLEAAALRGEDVCVSILRRPRLPARRRVHRLLYPRHHRRRGLRLSSSEAGEAWHRGVVHVEEAERVSSGRITGVVTSRPVVSIIESHASSR